MEAVYDKIIPKHLFPIEYLPDDYTGPNNGHIKDLISKFMADYLFHYSIFQSQMQKNCRCQIYKCV